MKRVFKDFKVDLKVNGNPMHLEFSHLEIEGSFWDLWFLKRLMKRVVKQLGKISP